MSLDKNLEWLGWKVKDKVTGFVGVVNHVGVDLYGCLVCLVQPPAITKKEEGQSMPNQQWFDLARLQKQGSKRVMEPIPVKGVDLVAGADFNKPTR